MSLLGSTSFFQLCREHFQQIHHCCITQLRVGPCGSLLPNKMGLILNLSFGRVWASSCIPSYYRCKTPILGINNSPDSWCLRSAYTPFPVCLSKSLSCSTYKNRSAGLPSWSTAPESVQLCFSPACLLHEFWLIRSVIRQKFLVQCSHRSKTDLKFLGLLGLSFQIFLNTFNHFHFDTLLWKVHKRY